MPVVPICRGRRRRSHPQISTNIPRDPVPKEERFAIVTDIAVDAAAWVKKKRALGNDITTTVDHQDRVATREQRREALRTNLWLKL